MDDICKGLGSFEMQRAIVAARGRLIPTVGDMPPQSQSAFDFLSFKEGGAKTYSKVQRPSRHPLIDLFRIGDVGELGFARESNVY
jgi:hypothetical protein